MAYTQLGIINMALLRIGAKPITSLSQEPNGPRAAAVYDYILDELLQEEDWKFAKTRVLLGTGTEIEDEAHYSFDYAYQLPSDFLRLARPTRSSTKSDPPVYPEDYDYKIETVTIVDEGPPETSAECLCLLTDYVNENEDMYIVYIKRQTDETLYFAKFINALAFRLAAELALIITESPKKYSDMMQLYTIALQQAKAFNHSLDYVEGELGNKDWETARRD